MSAAVRGFEAIGRRSAGFFDQVGYGSTLLVASMFWLLVGWRRRQPVRIRMVFHEMQQVGVAALPIATLLSGTIGLMLAIQSLYSLGLFGAEAYAYIGIALSVVREFSPLIMAILVAGRSGSAIAARLATMTINQEVDALQVMGINPVRYLVSPVVVALAIMLPCLSMWANLVSEFTAGFYVSAALNSSLGAFVNDSMTVLKTGDVWHGIGKATLFGVLIALVAVVNGSSVTGGAEGVGKVTTWSVVQSICMIVVADMLFAYIATR